MVKNGFFIPKSVWIKYRETLHDCILPCFSFFEIKITNPWPYSDEVVMCVTFYFC